MSFDNQTMAFFGIMPIFRGTTASFGTQCCCPGLSSGIIYTAVGDGVKWFKPGGAIVDIGTDSNVYAWSLVGGQTRAVRYDPQGNETFLATVTDTATYEIDVASSGDLYLFGDSVHKVSAGGGVAWDTLLSGIGGHYSQSRDKLFIRGVEAFQTLNSTTGTADSFVSLGSGIEVVNAAGVESFQTDTSGNVYVALSDSNPGGGQYIAKFTGSATSTTWTTSTATGAGPPMRFDPVNGKLFCYANMTGTVVEIDAATGAESPVNYSSDWTMGSLSDVDVDGSGNVYLTGQSFGGTNYAVIRYDSGTAYWGYRPSNFFDFSATNFSADPTGTAIVTSNVFEYAKVSQPLF